MNFFPGTINPFGYIAIFIIVSGLWGIINGFLHKEYDWITTFVLILTIGVILDFSLLGI
ncbi:MAG: hypothetical protein WCF28_06975 [Methanobacterium sp.]